MGILQGTTPTLRLILPEDLPVSSLDEVELTFHNAGSTLVKGLADVTLDTEDNAIVYVFSESETLKLATGTSLVYQLRTRVGSMIQGTKKQAVSIYDLISDKEMA